jgi:NADH-quinone oxidoreductase E subunit
MQPFTPPVEDLRQREACRLESAGHPVEFSAEMLAELETIQRRYPTRQASLLPALWLAQQTFGWISREVLVYVARLLDLPPSHVYGVVSFYTMFHRAPVGRYHLQLCTNLSCQLRGAEHILDCLRGKLGLELGQTGEDGLFSLEEVECLAACEMAPVLQVNQELVGPMNEVSVGQLVDRLRTEAKMGRVRGAEAK